MTKYDVNQKRPVPKPPRLIAYSKHAERWGIHE